MSSKTYVVNQVNADSLVVVLHAEPNVLANWIF